MYDKSVASKFAEVLKQKVGGDTTARPTAAAGETDTLSSEEEEEINTDSDHSDSDTVQEEEEEGQCWNIARDSFELFISKRRKRNFAVDRRTLADRIPPNRQKDKCLCFYYCL